MTGRNATEITPEATGSRQIRNSVDGGFVALEGDAYYRIRNYNLMPPFLMSVVSSSDHWMFLSSTGGITAGRRNSDTAVFPYYSDDRVSENAENTGPVTIVRATVDGSVHLWQPFSSRCADMHEVTRSLYKNVLGTSVVFEEVNPGLGLTFRYGWTSSEQYGFVRTSWLQNDSGRPVDIEILDGLQNILPYGVTTATQSTLSNLLNAYKRSELDPETSIGIYSMSSTLTDLAEPSESLLATRVVQCGLTHPTILLSTAQMEAFREGATVREELDVRGVRGAYLASWAFSLNPDEQRTWKVVADVEQDARHIVSLANRIRRDAAGLSAAIESDIRSSDRALLEIVAGADGLQSTGDKLASVHHFSNVLFNILRGGTFTTNYTIDRSDLLDVIRMRNRGLLEEAAAFLDSLPERLSRDELVRRVLGTGIPDLERICAEYLPLAFSRRHGDPSRPWNVFSIKVRNPDGSRRYDYQGNWRDIFQNWEALSWSYPHYLEGMIYRFVNATTADGYNPYRVTRDGVEWETPNPDNPWANIGYWGDHQIVYLLKLLETYERFSPGKLSDLLPRRVFSYANVPYRIRRYEEILEDWYDTIIFDDDLHARIEAEVRRGGSDARLLQDEDGQVVHVSFVEKLLVLLLAKLANLVPGGGIWMNTQRPEWNDANNALVGKGLSVVTAAYLRRFVVFLRSVLAGFSGSTLAVSEEVAGLFRAIDSVFQNHAMELDSPFPDDRRRAVMDALGGAASDYRRQIYSNGLSGNTATLAAEDVMRFVHLAERFIEHTLNANQRPDGLYHSYNTLELAPGRAAVHPLYEMLEGQVAILSSGLLSPAKSCDLLSALRNSRMYRSDQHSYLLYPDRDLPGFLEKNRIPGERADGLRLVTELVNGGDESLVLRDEEGIYHFNGRFRNRNDVVAALEQLESRYPDLVKTERADVLELFESVFRHNSFTGRSGTFFAYEGLGSIYWHMVSKLLLAVQETLSRAVRDGADDGTVENLRDRYFDIRMGLGFNKSPDLYGAFPTDPYSHSPSGRGAKQPGMTGQVKEEILTRSAELGLVINAGRIGFETTLLRDAEFCGEPHEFRCVDVDGEDISVNVPAGALAFTFCQVPVVVQRSDRDRIVVTNANGDESVIDGGMADATTSEHVFARDGLVRSLRAEVVLHDA